MEPVPQSSEQFGCFFVDSFEALLSEDEGAPTRSDSYDLSNLTIVPYVDALAMPALVINFAAKAQRRLVRREGQFDGLRGIHSSADAAPRAAHGDLSR
jgi:hypothetical protein